MTDRIQDEAAIFEEALALADPRERQELLDSACGDNVELRRRVDALLAASDKAGDFMRQPAVSELTKEMTNAPLAEMPGDKIGRYKLLERIGEGGFGVVYMAEQQEPVVRRVALKIIKLGMDTKQVIARFEAERQALALMEHPHIATVLDAGTTDSGRPYFVMELVRGVPITEYSDVHRLPTANRLILFRQVCSAVQHAHQKGIIHRDIKPNNILVTTDGDNPIPKVIDFGIAKATQGRLTDKTLFTQFHQFIGTPAYMSPEQAQMSAIDVDTRSDVYSLGVLLYELLTGTTPLDDVELSETGFEEICRRIREDEAPRPSRRISSYHQDRMETLAENRRSDPAEFRSMIQGDLDWIVMKSVEKDRSRRYPTADALADDIERYLDSEPVTAVPPSISYSARKLIRRNRGLFTALAVIVATLAVATAVSTWSALSTIRAHSRLALEVAAKGEAVKLAEANEADAISARTRIERNLYFHRISRALREWLINDVAQAEQLLSDCPPEYHDWEHGFLKRLIHSEVRELCREGPPIRDITFSPDGRLVAGCRRRPDPLSKLGDSGNDISEIIVWDVRSGETIHSFPSRDGESRCMAFSPDGEQLAIGYRNPGGIAIRDVRSGEVIFQKRESSIGSQNSLMFSPIEQQLVSTSGSRIHVWNLETRTIERSLLEHEDSVFRAVYCADGRLIASASFDRTARVWHANTGELLHTLHCEGDTRSVAFDPLGHYLACVGYTDQNHGFLKIWDVRVPEPKAVSYPIHDAPVTDVKYHPDGQHIAIGLRDGTVRICDARSGLQSDQIRAHSDWVVLAFNPIGLSFATCSGDGSAKLWDWTRRREPKYFAETEIRRSRLAWVRGSAFSPNSSEVALAGDRSLVRSIGRKTIQIWDLTDIRNPTLSREIGGDNGWLTSVAYNAEGNHIAAGSRDHVARVWNAFSGKLLFKLAEHEAPVTSVGFAGSKLISTSADQSIKIWELESTKAATLVGHQACVNSVAVSPDARLLLSGSDDNTARIWHLASRSEIDSLPHDDRVTSVAWSNNGRWVATGLANGTVNVWEVVDDSTADDSNPTATIRVEHRHSISAGPMSVHMAFHPNGRRLATASERFGRIKLWDVETGQEAFTFPKYMGVTLGVSFSSDGSRLAAARHFSLVIWEAHSESSESGESLGLDETERIRIWHEREAKRFRKENRWQGVAYHLDRLLNLEPQNVNNLFTRGWAYAEQAFWGQAISDFSTVVNLQPEHGTAWGHLALLHLQCGNLQAYQEACQTLRNTLDTENNPAKTNSIAWTCCVGPQAVADPEIIVSLSEQALAQSDRNRYYYLNTLGAALYRAKRYDQALERLRESIADQGNEGLPHDWLFLAMAHDRLGRHSQAIQWLDKAREWINRHRTEKDTPLSWTWRVELGALLEEAESLIVNAK